MSESQNDAVTAEKSGIMLKPIDEATRDELARYATIMAGVEVEPGDDKTKIKVKLQKAGFKPEHIAIIQEVRPPAPGVPRIAGEAPEASMRVSSDEKNANGEPRVYYHIRLHVSDREGGDEPVPVGVNGRTMYIPRGKDVWVPEEYVEVLKNAVEDHYDPADGPTGGLTEPRKVPSYPFSYV